MNNKTINTVNILRIIMLKKEIPKITNSANSNILLLA